MKDLKTKIKTSDVVVGTTVIDRQGFESLTFSVDVEDGTTIKLEDGDASDLSDAEDVTAAFIVGDLVFATEDGSPVTVGYVGGKRYVKLSYVDSSGPSGGAAIAILGHPDFAPVDQV